MEAGMKCSICQSRGEEAVNGPGIDSIKKKFLEELDEAERHMQVRRNQKQKVQGCNHGEKSTTKKMDMNRYDC